MAELGIVPVLPAFAGFVPPAFKDHYPNASLTRFGHDTFPRPHFAFRLQLLALTLLPTHLNRFACCLIPVGSDLRSGAASVMICQGST